MASARDGSKKPIGDVALLESLERMAAGELSDEIAEMSDAEVDAAVAAEGGDPKGIGDRGLGLVRSLLGKHRGEAPAWKKAAEARLDQANVAVRRAPRVDRSRMTRTDLLRAISKAKKDPRFSQQVAAAFRGRAPEASSDAELTAILDEVDELAAIAAVTPGTRSAAGIARTPNAAKAKELAKKKATPKNDKKRKNRK